MLQYTQMAEENVRLKNDRKTSPPLRPAESRYNRLENDSDAMAISLPKEKAFDPDMFTLSPAPSSANIPALKSTAPRFRPLTEESDTEDLRPSAYTMRSVQPISIKPSREIYRKPSIGYQEMDVSSRSIPQGSVDVQMSGCSSSPIVSGFQHGNSREIAGPSNYRDREFRRPSVSRRPTLDSPAEEIGEDEMIRGELGRQKLQEILSSPAIMTTGMPAVESRRYSPESHSIPHTRNPSPISRGSSAAPNVLSSASSAAQQAERDRQERNRLAMATKDPTQQSQYSSSSSQQYNNYNRDIMHPQPTMPQRPQYTRRGSDSGNFRTKSHSVSSMSSSSMPMSNLAKSIRANQDGQRGQ
ncbi:hypothetical protein QCA50_005441 [Cerrena zonata]|uniref:Uncharacterized protein n=1 Tax=Cerrena zonata TaxID=2478898 RepID=A0AAW0GGY7_9APHY